MLDDRQLSDSLDLPRRAVVHEDVLGQRKTFAGLYLVEWLFLILSCVNIFIVIGLTIERVINTRNDLDSFDFTYSLLLLINSVFCIFYVFNGVLRERQYEIYAFVGAVLLVLTYCILEYSFSIKGRNLIKLIRLIIGSVLAPINVVLAIAVARGFGWLEFRIVGAAEALQIMYRQLHFFMSLQRFDLQAAASFLILVLEDGDTLLNMEEIITLSAGIPLLILFFILGFYAVINESKRMSWMFAFFSLSEPAYIVYRLVKMYMMNDHFHLCVNAMTSPCIHLYSTIGVGLFAFLVRSMLLYELYVVYHNFGGGLAERAFASLVNSERTSLLGRDRRRRYH